MAPTPANALVPPPPVLLWARPCSPDDVPDANSGRRRRFTVAATARPLTKEDLIAHLASGCKPRSDWRIGTEHEKFGFHVETLRPINYNQICELLNGIADRFGWNRVVEGNNIVGLQKGLQSISLEPGGQIELSGAPLETLHHTLAEVNSHLYQVKAVGEEMRIGFLGLGFQPKWDLSDTPIVPKAKFEIARKYMPEVGSFGLDMMFRTCSVQVNLDYSSEQDMITKLRAAIALQPDFMAGKLPQLPSERPTLSDWNIHLGSIYPEVRLKGFLEMRGADVGPCSTLCVLPAFWVGLLYDDESLQGITDMIADWTNEERDMLRRKVPLTGLKTQFRGGHVRDVAEIIVKLSKDGLQRRGHMEVGFLSEVDEIVRTGVTPAERLANLYMTKWQHNVDPVFREFVY